MDIDLKSERKLCGHLLERFETKLASVIVAPFKVNLNQDPTSSSNDVVSLSMLMRANAADSYP
jgi:hypothetical protein